MHCFKCGAVSGHNVRVPSSHLAKSSLFSLGRLHAETALDVTGFPHCDDIILRKLALVMEDELASQVVPLPSFPCSCKLQRKQQLSMK